jgi:hypothetical protein
MSIKLILAAFLFITPAFAGGKSVVELFTSQGCSSCPAADKFLGEMKKRDDLIVISWSVDLWDYLGWKDTLADATFTKRQRNYAIGRGDNKVYTPQMVFSGGDHNPGLDKREIDQAIKTTTILALEPVMAQTPDMVTIIVPPSSTPYYVIAVPISNEKPVMITRGENRGKTITYHRVARAMMPLLQANREGKTITLPKNQLPSDADSLVILLQSKDDKLNPKAILGAAELVFR